MLNIQKIFEAQDKLDRKVVEVHGLEELNLTGQVTQALYVELGELAQEIGFFKYWKKSKEIDKGRQYDEWADCLHFMASLGNKYGHVDKLLSRGLKDDDTLLSNKDGITYCFAFENIYKSDFSDIVCYGIAFGALVMIGLKLGMTFEDMEKAYFDKNQVNYDRLASGY